MKTNSNDQNTKAKFSIQMQSNLVVNIIQPVKIKACTRESLSKVIQWTW